MVAGDCDLYNGNTPTGGERSEGSGMLVRYLARSKACVEWGGL
jgi:hypothetical protein